ncbi:MAG: carboxymuconolactone decarboxylase family protein, partial [Acidimicrobiia bacterium]
DAPSDLKPHLAGYVERMGFLPNALKIYLHRPHLLKQIIRLNNAVMRHPENVLSEEFKYRMSFIISRTHGCRYCCAHHAHTLRTKWGLDDAGLEDVLSLRNPRDEREAAAWDFAHAASQGPEHVTEEMRRRLGELFSPEEVVEIACTLGFWAFYNRIHSNLAIPIEEDLLSESGWVDVPAG